ncbi:sentrin-specific protease 6-like [Stegodyphus dumicola]|uniref:sentrin-specific protease 6-like n=1 Tax=Stegodyphus dumicola TaxID=202533 RepID=UPI0015B372C4|nr:sentrin-specific protease 6-like [Stegodyphus dumicola]XP_035212425.1 sentrin-specific protease 6-like [Stegodyphus dumicola]XP_035212426.1 sentrin-specific protease 6-like [Stegodyphus dumicola]XP_035212427.1 sentrin-specific protease 6-like [Stegodyphus dumicola]XP_035212428.1 sentrin-specific protease 6-like [Stegodyphus dumicola]XP_035212429.1 sentrin-specific protease 6-like [Stegodyphus dumicola]XP_035212430.1 sentrin-specific protease 6-like [Stegodyphus dumicola]XP_035212431.1 sen
MKIEAKSPLLYVPVYLGSNGIIIEVPTLNNPKKLLSVVLTPKDVDYTLIHFGEHLNIVFIVTKSKFAECIKHELTEDNYFYFDPNSKDQKCKFIILWIDSITENQVEFLKYGFSGKTNIKEIDQETASEILVRSTPRQEPVIKFPPEEQITQKSSGFEIIIYPTPPQIGGIVVTRKDFATLNEKEYLNDVIIDFYLKYFLDQHPAESEKTHLFSSYFYCSLTQKSSFDNGQEKIQHHNRVHRWTKHVDIFSKDFIIIPINQNRHWFLAIICFPGQVTTNSDAKEDSEGEGNSHTQDENLTNGANVVKPMPMPEALDSSTHPDENYGNRRLEIPCIYIFDSLSGPDRREVITTLREYLDIEWTLKKGTRKRFDVSTIQGYILQCPQQKNNHDCGLYLLQYVESFFQNPIPFYLNSVPDLKNWFKAEDVLFKRSKIKALILNLQKKQLENTATICKERQ